MIHCTGLCLSCVVSGLDKHRDLKEAAGHLLIPHWEQRCSDGRYGKYERDRDLPAVFLRPPADGAGKLMPAQLAEFVHHMYSCRN